MADHPSTMQRYRNTNKPNAAGIEASRFESKIPLTTSQRQPS
jgi:hypothetical protein